MVWQTPKTNWKAGDVLAATDFNRIEGNILELKNGVDQAETPSGAQAKVNAHANLTNAHSATPAAIANRIIMRDSAGRAKVAAPAASDDIARLAEVNTRARVITGTYTGNGASERFINVGATPVIVWVANPDDWAYHKGIMTSEGCLCYRHLPGNDQVSMDNPSTGPMISGNGFYVGYNHLDPTSTNESGNHYTWIALIK